MNVFKTLFFLLFLSIGFNSVAQKLGKFKPQERYKSNSLVITQISKNTFIHTSFLQTQDFGYVPCNGLIVRNTQEVVIFDTPTNDNSAKELIDWIKEKLHCRIKAIIPTHFHDDCLGGLKAFENEQILSYANLKTIELARSKSEVIPQKSFIDSLVLPLGKTVVLAKFFGEGHTKDNVIGYFPSEKVMFGGCLIKEINASKGYLGDATISEWSNTVEKIKKAYPDVQMVVPGHGAAGNIKLLDYTIGLFKGQ